MAWTLFWDMHSGGDQKEPQDLIFIEAPKKEAESIFFAKFEHNPHRVTCTCCGEDYAIHESPTFEEATEWHRKQANVLDLEKFSRRPNVLVIPKEEIKDEEREVEVLEQGYVWIE